MLTDDSTPLSASAGFMALSAEDIASERVAQTGDKGMASVIAVTILSTAAFIAAKKKEN